jgi:hypothetical protein
MNSVETTGEGARPRPVKGSQQPNPGPLRPLRSSLVAGSVRCSFRPKSRNKEWTNHEVHIRHDGAGARSLSTWGVDP